MCACEDLYVCVKICMCVSVVCVCSVCLSVHLCAFVCVCACLHIYRLHCNIPVAIVLLLSQLFCSPAAVLEQGRGLDLWPVC